MTEAVDCPPPDAGAVGRRTRLVSRRTRWIATLTVPGVLLLAMATAWGYADSVTLPAGPHLSFMTTIYYADGHTVLGRLGTIGRLPVDVDALPDHVVSAVLSAEDRDFRDGGPFGRPSTIAVQTARLLFHQPAGRSARLFVLAAKLERRLTEKELLELYLTAVYFGRDSYGVEAAALAYFGKPARDLTTGEAIVLAGVIASPGDGRYDPTIGERAARRRWEEIRDGMVDPLGALTKQEAASLAYPTTVLPAEGAPVRLRGELHTGSVEGIVYRVTQEMRGLPLQGRETSHVQDGGYTIVSTVDQRMQAALNGVADPAVASSPLHGQPKNLRAAAAVVEPGTGRIRAYFGNEDAGGQDFATQAELPNGEVVGGHPPGAAFAAYGLAAALGNGISVRSSWDCAPDITAPADRRPPSNPSDRSDAWSLWSPSTPSSSAKPKPCTLAEAVRAGNVGVLYTVARKVGARRVVAAAAAAGIGSMWADDGEFLKLGTPAADAAWGHPLVGTGRYPVTVLDQATAMATYAAGGLRAEAHFVESVSRDGVRLYAAKPRQVRTGLTPDQVNDLTWVLSGHRKSRLPDGRVAALSTGAWGAQAMYNTDAWAVGFTPELGVAVWMGNRGKASALRDDNGTMIYGSGLPTQIFQGFLGSALRGTPVTAFPPPAFTGDPRAGDASPRG